MIFFWASSLLSGEAAREHITRKDTGSKKNDAGIRENDFPTAMDYFLPLAEKGV